MKKDFSNDDFTKLFIYMEKRFDAVDEKFEAVDARFDRIERILDKSAGDYKSLVDEHTAEVSAHDRFTDTLDDHETRIGQLEKLKQAA